MIKLSYLEIYNLIVKMTIQKKQKDVIHRYKKSDVYKRGHLKAHTNYCNDYRTESWSNWIRQSTRFYLYFINLNMNINFIHFIFFQ